MARFTYKFPRPSITVDVVFFGLDGDRLRVLLVRRKDDPHAGKWAFPGGFVEIDEPFDVAARRELREETGLDAAGSLAFLGVYGRPDRDPRGRTVSIAHATVAAPPLPEVKGADDAAEAAWVDVASADSLAFDHDEILADALRWLAIEVRLGPVGAGLLPSKFFIGDVEAMLAATSCEPDWAESWLESALSGKLVKRTRKPGQYAVAPPAPRGVSYVVEWARLG